MRRLTLIGFSIVVVSAALAATTGTAAARADASSACDSASVSQPFAPWGDLSSYALVPNGGFEQGASAWSLDGGAQVVNGNESFFVRDAGDKRALELGDSGTATSADVCVTTQDPTLRLFVRNQGSPLSLLQVSVTFTDVLGVQQTVPVSVVAAGADWQPTAPIAVAVNLLSLPVLSDGSSDITFQFTPVGSGGDWSIDDVYLDPFKTK